VARVRSSASELRRGRESLIARAELERAALRDATQDMQIASDRVARIAIGGLAFIRQYWLPLGVALAVTLFKGPRPVLRMVRTGLTVWQTVRLLRPARR
jgi:hypothetical protein